MKWWEILIWIAVGVALGGVIAYIVFGIWLSKAFRW